MQNYFPEALKHIGGWEKQFYANQKWTVKKLGYMKIFHFLVVCLCSAAHEAHSNRWLGYYG